MKEFLTVDDALVQRLSRDCAMHETLVREVVNAHTAGQLEMMPVARREVTAALGYAHDGPARAQLVGRDPVVHKTL